MVHKIEAKQETWKRNFKAIESLQKTHLEIEHSSRERKTGTDSKLKGKLYN